MSRSLPPDGNMSGIGFATCFEFIHDLDKIITTLDVLNPMRRRGWAVLKARPWHMAGFFKTEKEARQFSESMSSDYTVEYGSNRFGTDDFAMIQT